MTPGKVAKSWRAGVNDRFGGEILRTPLGEAQ
jgi:hypothetical protein